MQGNRIGHNCEDPVALAFIGAHVFIVEREGRVVRVPLHGGTLEALGEVSSPAGAATDGRALWVVELAEDGSLVRIDGDGVEKVAGGLPRNDCCNLKSAVQEQGIRLIRYQDL